MPVVFVVLLLRGVWGFPETSGCTQPAVRAGSSLGGAVTRISVIVFWCCLRRTVKPILQRPKRLYSSRGRWCLGTSATTWLT